MTARAPFPLPPSFDDLELAGYLRAQILDHAVRLDWSAVTHVDAVPVQHLLAGLDESTHGEGLGLDSALPLFAATLRLGLALHPPVHAEQLPLLRPRRRPSCAPSSRTPWCATCSAPPRAPRRSSPSATSATVISSARARRSISASTPRSRTASRSRTARTRTA